MKKLFTLAALCGALLANNVIAHEDHDHNMISSQGALSIAEKSLKQMTFKDFGFAVGKLNDSWKGLPQENFKVVSIEESYYIVSVKNAADDKQLFFKIANNGRVLDVKETNEF
ncbi:DUF6488 family protein [Pseudoalteromonas xiamenensis]|uniref:DUF6488 family protein n=1 Tax=Pseudoalteromonas xiamenensis TaxID=882626 RepID=UPI0035EE7B9D